MATIPRECIDWLIPLSESYLRSILKSKEPLERLAIGATDAEKEMAVAIVVMLQRVRLAIHGVFPPKDEKQGRLPGLVRDAHAPLRWSAIVSNGTLCPRCEPAPHRTGNREARSDAHEEQRVAAGARDSTDLPATVRIALGAEPDLCA